MLVVGLPLVYLEMALGQFTTMNAILVFRRIAPIASGGLFMRTEQIEPKGPFKRKWRNPKHMDNRLEISGMFTRTP